VIRRAGIFLMLHRALIARSHMEMIIRRLSLCGWDYVNRGWTVRLLSSI
jgi:hypothetical protein